MDLTEPCLLSFSLFFDDGREALVETMLRITTNNVLV